MYGEVMIYMAPLDTHRDRDSERDRRVFRGGAGRAQIFSWPRLCSAFFVRVLFVRAQTSFSLLPLVPPFPLITHRPPPAGPHSLQSLRHAPQRPLPPPPRPRPRPRRRQRPILRPGTSSETPCPRPCSRRRQPPPPSSSGSRGRQWHSCFHRRRRSRCFLHRSDINDSDPQQCQQCQQWHQCHIE